MGKFIAVDIGGTQMRAALFPADGLEHLKLERISTQAAHTTPLERLHSLLEKIWPEDGDVAALAVAAPGPVDPFEGIILEAPNIPGWVDLHLRDELQERFHVSVMLGNDANLAGLGEWKYGAGQGHHDVIYMTVSTGIGGGVICGDRLLLGQRGLAAELGHVTVLPDGPKCGCGLRGHLEALASGTAIARWVEGQIAAGAPSSLPGGQALSAKLVAQAAKQGDPLAVSALERAGSFIGQVLADYLHIFNPSAVIIGGGVSQSGDLLMRPIKKALSQHVLSSHYLDHLSVTTASFGDEAGLMGALALAHSLDESPDSVKPLST